MLKIVLGCSQCDTELVRAYPNHREVQKLLNTADERGWDITHLLEPLCPACATSRDEDAQTLDGLAAENASDSTTLDRRLAELTEESFT